MGNACASDTLVVSMDQPPQCLQSSTVGDEVSAASLQGYHSRRTSIQHGALARDKYINESEEDRYLRLRVFDACMTGRVRPVQDLVNENGEYCLDLRSTSMVDDIGIEPLPSNVLRYRKARASGGSSGIAESVLHPASGQEVLERSMGMSKIGTASAITRQRRPLPPPQVAQLSMLRPSGLSMLPPPLPVLPEPNVAAHDISVPIPHLVVVAENEEHREEKHAVNPMPSFAQLSGGGFSSSIANKNEISMASDFELQQAAQAAAGGEIGSPRTDATPPTISPKSVTSAAEGHTIANSNSSPLILAATVGSRDLVAYLLLHGQELNEVVHRTTALIAAVRNAHGADIVRFLVLRGAKSHIGRGLIDRQALHYAAEVGDVAVVRTLLENKAVVNWLSRDGVTALHVAVRKGFADVVKVLLEFGADPSIREVATGLHCFDITSTMNFADISTYLKHHKRSHPTQFGATSAYKPNNGIINGTLESDMCNGARAAASVRPQAIREYLTDSSPTNSNSSSLSPNQIGSASVRLDKNVGLNPALSRSAALIGVPSNPPLQKAQAERANARKKNPNSIATSMEASSRNPRPSGDTTALVSPGVIPGFEIMGYSVGAAGKEHASGDEGPGLAVPVPGLAQQATPAGHGDRSAKAMFHQHGWSEKTFHTNMSRKPPPRALPVEVGA